MLKKKRHSTKFKHKKYIKMLDDPGNVLKLDSDNSCTIL